MTCKSKLSLLSSKMILSFKAIFHWKLGTPYKSLVSTIWIREITWGQTSFFGVTNIYQTYDHKNTFTEPLLKSRFWPLLWKRYCTDLSSFSPLNIQCIVDFSLKQRVKQVIYESKIKWQKSQSHKILSCGS